MNNPRVTVAVVPREGFSGSTRCLDSIYSNSAVPFNLVFVDGGSPGRIRRHLEQESERRGYKPALPR